MKIVHLLVAVLGATAAVDTARAEKITIDEDTSLTVSALLQPQAAMAENSAPDGSAGTDFFLRRARLILGGQITSKVGFFVDTEQANLGKDGNWETSVFIQDAFASLELVDKVFIDAGMMLLPLTRHTLQSAASLNGIDYHAALIKFPAGSNRIWRDAGVQVRADIANLVHVRAGVYNGVEGTPPPEGMELARNESDLPRFTAHARVNILGGAEKGFFFPGISFTDKPMVSVGVGADWQQDVIMTAEGANDHVALAADVFAEIPTLADQEVIFQALVANYSDGDGVASTGLGFFAEAGYRIAWIEPIVAIENFSSDVAGSDFQGYHVGAAAFIDKHRTNVKLDLALTKTGDADSVGSAALQAQLFF